MKFSWNPTLEVSSRVLSVQVLNPETGQYSDLQPNEVYSVATVNFVATGGDGFSSIPGTAIGRSLYGPSLDGVLLEFVQANSPLNYGAAEGRIVVSDRQGLVFGALWFLSHNVLSQHPFDIPVCLSRENPGYYQ
jgi:5'-nucleotidase